MPEDEATLLPLGDPEDLKLLVNFRMHVAQAILEGQERGTLRLHHHLGFLGKWQVKEARLRDRGCFRCVS